MRAKTILLYIFFVSFVGCKTKQTSVYTTPIVGDLMISESIENLDNWNNDTGTSILDYTSLSILHTPHQWEYSKPKKVIGQP